MGFALVYDPMQEKHNIPSGSADNIIVSKSSEIYHLLGVFYKSPLSAPYRPGEKDIQ